MTKEKLSYVVPNNMKSWSWTLSSSPSLDIKSYRLWTWNGELQYARAPSVGIGARPALYQEGTPK